MKEKLQVVIGRYFTFHLLLHLTVDALLCSKKIALLRITKHEFDNTSVCVFLEKSTLVCVQWFVQWADISFSKKTCCASPVSPPAAA